MFRKLLLLYLTCLAGCFILSCNKTKERLDHPELENDSFIISNWSNVEANFDSLKWINKLNYYDSLGISELLLGGTVESLEKLVPLANLHGIKIHAWIWTLNRPNDSIAMKHPEWYAVNRKGQNSLEYRAYVNYYQWLSPWHPEARAYIKSNVKKLLNIEGLSSVHLDYVRYVDVVLGKNLQPKYNIEQTGEFPEYDFGYHPIARDSFVHIFGVDPLDLAHPELSNEWRQFRLNAVTSLVNEIADVTHEAGVELSAAVFPFPEMSRQMVRQDWSSWQLDRAYPMLYHKFYDQSTNWIGFALEQGLREADFPLFPGLFMPAFKDADEDFINAIQLCKDGGASGVSLFTANNLTKEQEAILLQFKD